MRIQYLPALVCAFVAAPFGISQAQDVKPDAKLNSTLVELVRSSDSDGLKTFWEANPAFLATDKLGAALREAILARDETLAKSLVERAATPEEAAKIINAADAQGRTALFFTVDVNSADLVKYLLSKGADMSLKTTYGSDGRTAVQTPLQHAYVNDRPEMLRLLLESNDPNLKKTLFAQTSSDFGVNTILSAALRGGNRPLTKIALTLGPNLKDTYYTSSLWRSVATAGDIENAKALLEAGAALDLKPRDPLNQAGTAALVEAVKLDRVELAKFLLANGADVNALGGQGAYESANQTALGEAVKNGNAEMVDFLMRKGAEANPAIRYAGSPLSTAIANGDYEIAKKLIATGASLRANAPGSFDAALRNDTAALEARKTSLLQESRDSSETVLHYAALFGTPATLDWLDQNGVKQTATRKGQTPIFWAVNANNLPAVEWFLKHGADPNATDTAGQNLLHIAAAHGSAAMIAALLAANVDVNAILPNGQSDLPAFSRGVTPLHRAALLGNLPAINAFLAAGAEVNALTSGKSTPLYAAALTGQSEAVKLLLSKGADVKLGSPVLLAAAREYNFTTPGGSFWTSLLPRPYPVQTKAVTIAALVAADADPKGLDAQGNNPLFAVLSPPRFEEGGGDGFSTLRRFWDWQRSGKIRAGIIRELVKGGVDVNARCKTDISRLYGISGSYPETGVGPTPLNVAVASQDVAAVRALLESGADPVLEDGVGRTPMDIALRRGENSQFLEDVPFANFRNYGGASYDKPAPTLVEGPRQEIVQLLTAAGADKMGRGPFLRAIVWGASKWVKSAVAKQPELVKVTANMDFYNGQPVKLTSKPEEYNASPALTAVSFKHPDLARFLLAKGAPYGPLGWSKRNLLFTLAEQKDWVTMDQVLQLGAQWEAESSEQNTPLHIAAQRGFLDTVQELVKRKAPLDVKNKAGQTPLKMAIVNRKDEVAQFLREQGAPE